jgi:hypothetical protein
MKRFAEIGPQELEEIENARISKQTKYNDVYVENLILSFCVEKNLSFNHDKEQLDDLLSRFLSCVRTKNGDLFSSGTLTNMYHSSARIIMKKYGFDIRDDNAFSKCSHMLKNMKALSKRVGKGVIEHTEVITEFDLKKVGDMDYNSPVRLQWKVWILLQMQFAKRGNENSHGMKKTDLIFNVSDKGEEYITLRDNITKNHRGSELSSSYGGALFANSHTNCPVGIVRLYLSHLHPKNEYLWQRPRNVYSDDDVVWFCDSKIGVNKLRSFLPEISAYLKLSKRYTNHSLRATSITLLGEHFEDTDVQCVSGHKSTSSLSIYKRTSLGKRQSMSHHLDLSMNAQTLNCSDATEVEGQRFSLTTDVQQNASSKSNCEKEICIPDSVLSTDDRNNQGEVALKKPNESFKTSSENEIGIPDSVLSTDDRNDHEEVALKKPCLRVDGNTFSFSGSHCNININFQTSK